MCPAVQAAVKEQLTVEFGNGNPFGICHSFGADGRCISLLKILMTNICMYDCKYCINRKTNDVPRAILSPREIADTTINFYKRNYIEGLFLSSGIIKSPDYTMEQMYQSIYILRKEYKFNGYIHAKAIPRCKSGINFKTRQSHRQNECKYRTSFSRKFKTARTR